MALNGSPGGLDVMIPPGRIYTTTARLKEKFGDYLIM